MADDRRIAQALRQLELAVDMLRRALEETSPANGKDVDLEFLETDLECLDLGPGYTVRARGMFSSWSEWTGEKYDRRPLRTVRDLVRLKEYDIMRAPNVGRRTLESLKVALKERGLHFGMDV